MHRIIINKNYTLIKEHLNCIGCIIFTLPLIIFTAAAFICVCCKKGGIIKKTYSTIKYYMW